MEWLQHLVDSSNFPLFTAFLLGLMTAISPCPLAMNITAKRWFFRQIQRQIFTRCCKNKEYFHIDFFIFLPTAKKRSINNKRRR
jgi:hypothetical protein